MDIASYLALARDDFIIFVLFRNRYFMQYASERNKFQVQLFARIKNMSLLTLLCNITSVSAIVDTYHNDRTSAWISHFVMSRQFFIIACLKKKLWHQL